MSKEMAISLQTFKISHIFWTKLLSRLLFLNRFFKIGNFTLWLRLFFLNFWLNGSLNFVLNFSDIDVHRLRFLILDDFRSNLLHLVLIELIKLVIMLSYHLNSSGYIVQSFCQRLKLWIDILLNDHQLDRICCFRSIHMFVNRDGCLINLLQNCYVTFLLLNSSIILLFKRGLLVKCLLTIIFWISVMMSYCFFLNFDIAFSEENVSRKLLSLEIISFVLNNLPVPLTSSI